MISSDITYIITETFIDFLGNTIKTPGHKVGKWNPKIWDIEITPREYPVFDTITKYKQYPSHMIAKEKLGNHEHFFLFTTYFRKTSQEYIARYKIIRLVQFIPFLYIRPSLRKLLCNGREGIKHKMLPFTLMETWKRNIDKTGVSGALLTDLSKAICYNIWRFVDIIYHEPLH